MTKIFKKANQKLNDLAVKAATTLKNKRGEAYIDTGVKILIAVVIGALLLTTIYTLFDDTILTTLSGKLGNLFEYEAAANF